MNVFDEARENMIIGAVTDNMDASQREDKLVEEAVLALFKTGFFGGILNKEEPFKQLTEVEKTNLAKVIGKCDYDKAKKAIVLLIVKVGRDNDLLAMKQTKFIKQAIELAN